MNNMNVSDQNLKIFQYKLYEIYEICKNIKIEILKSSKKTKNVIYSINYYYNCVVII